MSMPFFGKEFTFTQPDGTSLTVRGYGDQYRARFETTDGYPLVLNPETRFYEYATVSADGTDLAPTGTQPGQGDPKQLGLQGAPRPVPEAMPTHAPMVSTLQKTPTRWETRRNRARMEALMKAALPGMTLAPPRRGTVGTFVGLCLLIDFPDVPATIGQQEVDDFCNKKGYTGFGNKGSVYDYFYDNSDGKLQYTNIVAPYYTAKHPRSYYTNESIPQPTRAWELIKEALAHFVASGFDFSPLTVDSQNYVYALNVFYAGPRVNNWAMGLWPHSYHLQAPYQLAPGKLAYDYQFTDMGNELTLGTFCHENGHMICDFPDLYDYGYDSYGTGVYCLMCAGGNANPKNPAQIGAYLKHAAGWGNTVTASAGMKVMLDASKNDFVIHRKDQTEYFIMENRRKAGRDEALTDEGLAIWHVDELGSNNNQQMSPSLHYECSLVQADGKNELEHQINQGDKGDLFAAKQRDRFSDTTTPRSVWWDGSPSGLDVRAVSAPGPLMRVEIDLPSPMAATGPATTTAATTAAMTPAGAAAPAQSPER